MINQSSKNMNNIAHKLMIVAHETSCFLDTINTANISHKKRNILCTYNLVNNMIDSLVTIAYELMNYADIPEYSKSIDEQAMTIGKLRECCKDMKIKFSQLNPNNFVTQSFKIKRTIRELRTLATNLRKNAIKLKKNEHILTTISA